MRMTWQLADMASSSKLFGIVLFFFSSIVTGPSFMSIASLVLEILQFFSIRYWPEIRKSKIYMSEFLLNISRLSWVGYTNLIKCYWILENAWVTTFTISELLRDNQRWCGDRGWLYSLPRLGLKKCLCSVFIYSGPSFK